VKKPWKVEAWFSSKMWSQSTKYMAFNLSLDFYNMLWELDSLNFLMVFQRFCCTLTCSKWPVLFMQFWEKKLRIPKWMIDSMEWRQTEVWNESERKENNTNRKLCLYHALVPQTVWLLSAAEFNLLVSSNMRIILQICEVCMNGPFHLVLLGTEKIWLKN
jgi:hypothetical protein